MKKRIISWLMVMCIMASLIIALPIAASAETSGTCGDSVIWQLDDNGTLTITGTGDMWDCGNPDTHPLNGIRSKIKSVIIENGVTNIGDCVFFECNMLASVKMPNSITSIGQSAFVRCEQLQSIVVPESVTSIEQSAFSGCESLKQINIPSNISEIKDGVFSHCTGLTQLEIPTSVNSIGRLAFNYCSGLTHITIPGSVTSLDSLAFGNCTNLQSVTLSDGLTTIIMGAFEGCSSLTHITIPDTVIRINGGAFAECEKLISIEVMKDNSSYSACDGILFNKDKTAIVQFPGGKSGAYAIPDSVTSIEGSAFRGCSNLTSITIPSSVTSIGARAFWKCSSLTSITLPSSVMSIKRLAFRDCSSLTSITLPNGVTNIGEFTFDSCSNLASIDIPSSVTSIDMGAFSGCESLKDVYYGGNESDWTEISIEFGNDPLLNATIHYNSYNNEGRQNVQVTVNGQPLAFDQPPIIIDGRTLVPLRAIFEALGATVEWDDATKTVTAQKDGTKIQITIGDNKLYKNGSPIELDVPAQIVNGRTLVPVRAISEAFGCDVSWDGNTRTVYITSYFSATFTASDRKIGTATVYLKTGFDFVKTDSSQPNLELALTATTLSSQIYTNAQIMHADKILEGLEYDSVMITQGGIASYERPVSCFAYKHLDDGSNVFTVVVRGTDSAQGNEDVLTDIGDGIFTMFEDSAEAVRDELEQFMQQVTGKSSEELKHEKNYFFFTGHSLGGAVANCLSVDNVIKEYASNEKGRIYTYTFESPHTCVHLWGTDPESESNAFNFKVDGDAVTNLPPYMGSTTYGKDVWIKVSELDDAVFNKLFTNSLFNKLDGNVGLHDTCLGLIYIECLLQ